MSIIKRDDLTTVIITGTELSTPQQSVIQTIRHASVVRKYGTPPSEGILTSEDSGNTQLSKTYARFPLKHIYDYLVANGGTYTRNVRYKNTPRSGFNIRFSLQGGASPYLTAGASEVSNGVETGTISPYNRIYDPTLPLDSVAKGFFVDYSNEVAYLQPALVFEPEDNTVVYFANHVSDLDEYGHEVVGWRCNVTHYLRSADIDDSEAPNYPFPTDDEESGGGTQDGNSDDIDIDDDALMDGISDLISGNGITTTYKVTKTQLGQIAAELWDNNYITQLKNIFANPMDGIVSVFCLPFSVDSAMTSTHVKIGGCEMLSTAYVVKQASNTIDCGTIQLDEYYGSFIDYNATNVSIYLPFVGIQPLNVQHANGASINVTYKVDVLTGAFNCYVSYVKKGRKQILNTFSGSMSYQIPLTANQHSGVVASLSQVANGVNALSAGHGGGALANVAGAVASYLPSHVRTIGNFNANIGYLSNRTPYLIIERANAVIPATLLPEKGAPSNITKKIEECHGFTRFSKIELTIPHATSSEVERLTSQLKSGVHFQ